MKIQFDAKQSYQIDAVNAVVDLFDGADLKQPDYATIMQTFDTELFGSVAQTDLGIANHLIVSRDALLKNLQAVQERNDLDVDQNLEPHTYDANAPAPLNFRWRWKPARARPTFISAPFSS
jgi:type III restriction enzyme